jgi:hypothetical protein
MLGIFGEVHANVATGVVCARAHELALPVLAHGISVRRRRTGRAAPATVVRVRLEVDATAATHSLTLAASTEDALRWLCFQVAQVTGQTIARWRAALALEARRKLGRASKRNR